MKYYLVFKFLLIFTSVKETRHTSKPQWYNVISVRVRLCHSFCNLIGWIQHSRAERCYKNSGRTKCGVVWTKLTTMEVKSTMLYATCLLLGLLIVASNTASAFMIAPQGYQSDQAPIVYKMPRRHSSECKHYLFYESSHFSINFNLLW